MRVVRFATAALAVACAREVPPAAVSLPFVVASPQAPKGECLPGSLDVCHALAHRVLPTDPRHAFQYESLACEGGMVAACGELGWMMLRGVWGASDTNEALFLIEGACSAGLVESCVMVGVLDRDAHHDDAAAAEIFRHYCDDRSVGAACDELGSMVESGRGFAADRDAAARIFEHACALGSPAGCGDFGRVIAASNPTRSHALLAGACRAHDGRSCYALGRYELSCNLGVPQGCLAVAASIDSSARSLQALWWIDRACDQREASACETLALRINAPHLHARARALTQ